ncbi:MAG: FtsW/RodA/SpoVE family cell cycle protein [Ruminococcus sp.]|nr:FtsW/RodA/SpoVE family cell cycle protein [Ruminococcus sp.]
MFHNKLRYGNISILVLLTHLVMLAAVLFRGNYEDIRDIVPLTIAVFSLDIVYMIVIRFFYKQMTYTTDYLLLLILNCSVIFQSCFGGIGFASKHYITCVAALVCCQIMFLLTRNHLRVLAMKQYLYLVLGALILAILFLTGSRSMWINIGPISIQPSEFMKPVFVLLCATSIMEQHPKKKVLMFHVSREMIALTIAFFVIFVLQWWCRDLGSLPTFAAAYGCAILCRICYPKAKFSKGTLLFLCALGVCAVAMLAAAAPGYVQARLSVDIWEDTYGDGWQQCQALMAIAEGALFGKGPGYGKLIQVPAADTDIVFSTICEEWGFFVALLIIFFVVSLLILPMINKPRSYFHATMVMGVAAVFIVQMGLNIFGSCNLIPFTGVTIPFISQGGSSMVVCGMLTGMLKAGQSPVFRRPDVQRQLNAQRRKEGAA